MNYDELAVVCEQLAGMLRTGMPLPESLSQVAGTLPRGRVRRETERLAADLARGEPLGKAVDRGRLPVLMKTALAFGIDDMVLAETLSAAATHYRRHHELWSRIRLLVGYTAGVAMLGIGFMAAILSLLIWYQASSNLEFEAWGLMNALGCSKPRIIPWRSSILPALFLWLVEGVILVGLILIGFSRVVRERLFWRLPGAKEAQLCLLASGISLLMRQGRTLPEALEVVLASTSRHPAWTDLRHWQKRLADGYVGLWETTNRYKWFPPMFVWLIDRDGENLEFGFRRAAEIYEARVLYKASLWQHCLLPVGLWFISGSILTAGILFSYQMLKSSFLNGDL
jgi:type II secretory pathway component PulF